MKVDISDLKSKLGNLTGMDFERAEMDERTAGNTAFDMTFSKSFQIRLAAMALGVNPYDIKELPLPQYTKIGMEVFNFLFSSGVDETEKVNSNQKTPSTKLEE